MPKIIFPFDKQARKCKHDSAEGCSVSGVLPQEMREVTSKHPHLLSYLHLIPLGEVGVPRYCETLSQNMSDLTQPNILYPVRGNIFIHILNDPHDVRNTYIPIEPILDQNIDSLMQEFEKKLLEI